MCSGDPSCIDGFIAMRLPLYSVRTVLQERFTGNVPCSAERPRPSQYAGATPILLHLEINPDVEGKRVYC